ncbi:uncharacterized protein LOC135955624 [Calliphora vicina]|uniref:uncharacterized protein LOC135955624 n=1 Tax=Calliphora vicina TaxID=7373 RepID=UPI00325AE072
MPTVGGPRQSRRIWISRVTNSTLLHGAPVWENTSSKKKMLAIFRRGCLRVCSGFRTISGEAASVVAGIIPVDIVAKELSNVYKELAENPSAPKNIIRKLEREKITQSWQRRWENSPKGRWTFRLLPHIEK